MRLSRSWLRTGVLAGLLFLVMGCEAASEQFAPVQGTVSFRGVPLRSGTIVFTPDGLRGTHGPLARAEIQADGSYLLRSGAALGAVVGWHRVTIAAVELPATPSPGQRFVRPRSLVPENYRDPELAGLACEVRAGQDNRIDWNLN